jgi:hypothetical protein
MQKKKKAKAMPIRLNRDELTCETCVAIWRAQLMTNAIICLRHIDCILVLLFVAAPQELEILKEGNLESKTHQFHFACCILWRNFESNVEGRLQVQGISEQAGGEKIWI